MKVLVTGASGFLGSWVVRALLGAGDEARVLARKTSRLEALAGLPVDLREGDVLDPRSVARAVKGVDAVVHLAGLHALRRRDRDALFRVNVEGTRNVLQAAAARGVRAIHTSTIGAIGLTDGPIVLDETARLAPERAAQYPYAASKLAAEAIADGLARAGADVVVLNPGLLLGPGDLRRSSTRFIHAFLEQQAPFFPAGGTSFGDVRGVAAMYPVALRKARCGERYILAGLNRTYRELFELIARAAGRPRAWPLPSWVATWWGLASDAAGLFAQHPFEEFSLGTVAYSTRFNYCDSSKANAELGYAAGDFEALVRETVADLLGASPRARALTRRASETNA
ncbi:MAG TPA: SDR family NAD(P)-dependent oxidoreductase [Polyangia bacterium]|nr:SDR family NAD(P)-dependent oxidoreductase [Polyangia bacterium]